MYILSIGGRYKPTNGGNAKRISTMCEAFSRQGNKVTVMTCDGNSSENSQETIRDVEVLRYTDCNKLTANVKSVIRKKKVDIILVHEETYVRKLKGMNILIPIVYECHAIEPNPNKIKEAILTILRKWYFDKKFIKRVFVLSKNAGKNFACRFSYPQELIVYTPNGLNKGSFYIDTMHYGESESFIYGYSGTLYEFQGIKILLKYAKDILNIASDVKIMIVGGGPMENEVKSYVKANGLEDRIIVTGSVSQEKFDELTQTFDVMLMPRPLMLSTESAVPLKIFDAAIHKKPVVMSNVSGLTEAYTENAALIYDSKNSDDFVKCCKKIYRNRELAQKLVEGEKVALSTWPSVDEVAFLQLEEMLKVIKDG